MGNLPQPTVTSWVGLGFFCSIAGCFKLWKHAERIWRQRHHTKDRARISVS